MTVGLPNFYDRPDRVHACIERHVGPCAVCGFVGVHDTRVQVLERRQFRGACTCSWYGPIRQVQFRADADGLQHRQR